MISNLPLPDAARVWGISRRTAYRLAEEGHIRVARFGRRVTVPAEEVERVRLAGAGPTLGPTSSLPDMSPPKPGRRKVDRRPPTTGPFKD